MSLEPAYFMGFYLLLALGLLVAVALLTRPPSQSHFEALGDLVLCNVSQRFLELPERPSKPQCGFSREGSTMFRGLLRRIRRMDSSCGRLAESRRSLPYSSGQDHLGVSETTRN